MRIRERCSCGARFEVAESKAAARLVREWRKSHSCPDKVEEIELRDVAMSAQVENAIGFRIEGLDVPAREYDPWEDKSVS